MSVMQLQQITALAANSYQVELTGTGEHIVIQCSVVERPGFPTVVQPKPDFFSLGYIRDPRLVVSAVIAFHKARHSAEVGET